MKVTLRYKDGRVEELVDVQEIHYNIDYPRPPQPIRKVIEAWVNGRVVKGLEVGGLRVAFELKGHGFVVDAKDVAYFEATP